MNVSRSFATLFLIVTTLSVLPTLSQNSQNLHWKTITASSPTTDSCRVLRSARELAAELKRLGWTGQSNDFPQIDWEHSYATVVTVVDKTNKPIDLAQRDGEIVAYVHSDPAFYGKGILVVETPMQYGQSNQCLVSHSAPIARSHISVASEADTD